MAKERNIGPQSTRRCAVMPLEKRTFLISFLQSDIDRQGTAVKD